MMANSWALNSACLHLNSISITPYYVILGNNFSMCQCIRPPIKTLVSPPRVAVSLK